MNGEESREISNDERMRLEMDDEFKALRHRYYALGVERRLRVLQQFCFMPDIPERTLKQHEEKQLLFICVLRGQLDHLKGFIEREEEAIAEEKALKTAV